MDFSVFKRAKSSAVTTLFTQTFSDSEGPTEGALIGELVHDLINDTDEKEILGFVAIEDKQIIGSIFFTRLFFDESVVAFILSPVAVHTNHQGKKIGQQLIKFGLDQLKEKAVKLVFTYGDPKFYSKVGFKQISESLAKAPFELTQPEGWLCQSLDESEIEPISGKSRCVKALNKTELW